MRLKLGNRQTNHILTLSLIMLVGLFIFSLFKNIAYPLLWNDETETVMQGERVLKFGYPKVHDGKNVVCPLNYPDMSLWIDKKTDAYIATGWGHAYFVAPLIIIANQFDDIYTKTAILRSGFAAAGLLGLLLFVWTLSSVFINSKHKLLSLNLFVSLCLISISLTLHLREVRYYSLVILLVASLLALFIRYDFFDRISYRAYTVLTIILSVIFFNTFYPAFVIFFATICLHQFLRFLHAASDDESKIKQISQQHLKPILPYFISLIVLIPFVIFFHTFQVNAAIAEYMSGGGSYWQKLVNVISFFVKYDFILLILFIKALIAYLRYFRKAHSSIRLTSAIRLSALLSQFFVIYIFVIAKSFLIFERYFIVLVPVLSLIFILDLFTLFDLSAVLRFGKKQKTIIAFCVIAIFCLSLISKVSSISGHVYEMSHPYKGPLDYAIAYIQEHYNNTEDLIIATNYEETAYMYYLGSKTIVGFVGNNLESDLKEKPDVVINRKSFNGAYDEIMNYFLNHGNFAKETIPVYDDRVNNIPELNNKFIFHRFKVVDRSQAESLDIYIRNENK